MAKFAQAVRSDVDARTENGMKARSTTSSKCVDLFYNIGASRGKNIVPAFTAAYVENKDIALRIALWARDVRGGAGERQIFRDVLKYLEIENPLDCKRLLARTPELGRFDDLFAVITPAMKDVALTQFAQAIRAGNGLACKWAPRKGPIAARLRNILDLSAKDYRKTIVAGTKVVEQQMCAKDWDNINFSHVPSVASSIYKKAFGRHTPKYGQYIEALKTGGKIDGKAVKINASAIFPHDVVKDAFRGSIISSTDCDQIEAQWNALPNYVGDAKILPLIDVSGSMVTPIGPKTTVTCLQAAVSIGLYLADKNVGEFKDTFLTFSGSPELVHIKGTIIDKLNQICRSKWAMNTNLHLAMDKILTTAKKGNVAPANMPKMLLILSDMQFDGCVQHDHSAIEMIEHKFEKAGYQVPQVVFWNFRSTDNTPVRFDKNGTALVSGFSPSILKSVLAGDLEQFTPEQVMIKTIMSDRYTV